MRKSRVIQSLLHVALVLAILVGINIISSYFHTQKDLTSDKRYSISDATTKLVNQQKDVIFVRVLLEGKFPSGFKRLQIATREMLQKFNSINPNIEYVFEDPLAGTTEESNQRKLEYSKDGINPTNLTYREGDEMTQKLVYPFVVFSYGKRKIIVNILEEQSAGFSDEQVLNNSVSLLEYKFANALQQLRLKEKPNVLISIGNGEFEDQQLASLTTELKRFYDVGRINLDSIYQIKKEADLVIVAGPRNAIDIKNQFKIDQYLMNGGKIIWLIEKFDVSLQKINENKFYVPPILELDLANMFFKYGIRIQSNLVLDIECTKIPSVSGQQGGKPQMQLFSWYYHPLIASKSNHPIVKNIDRVNLFFPSTIDTIKTVTPIKKTVLLKSSDYSRYQLSPMRLNFEILKFPPDAKKFNKGPQAVAVLLEGEFVSFFKNRVSQSMETALKQIGSVFKDKSDYTKQLFVSDADFIKNLYDVNSSRISPIGYNKWEDHTFKGNRDFMLNAIEYMLDEEGVLSTRAKEVKLRLLDKVKAKNERSLWQFVNIGIPLIILILLGLINFYYRRYKYARIKR